MKNVLSEPEFIEQKTMILEALHNTYVVLSL